MLKWFFWSVWGCSVHSCSCPWIGWHVFTNSESTNFFTKFFWLAAFLSAFKFFAKKMHRFEICQSMSQIGNNSFLVEIFNFGSLWYQDCFDDMPRRDFGWRVKVELRKNETCTFTPRLNPDLPKCIMTGMWIIL